MELLKELRRNSQKFHGAIPSIVPFNDDVFHQTLENIDASFSQVKILSTHENNCKNLEDLGLNLDETNPPATSKNGDILEDADENETLNIKQELALMKEIKLTDIMHDLRCLHAYQFERMGRLRDLKWSTGVTQLPRSVNDNLSKSEQAWYVQSVRNVKSFTSSRPGLKNLDLTTDLEPPSTISIITVKCNEDLGQVMLPNGVSVTF